MAHSDERSIWSTNVCVHWHQCHLFCFAYIAQQLCFWQLWMHKIQRQLAHHYICERKQGRWFCFYNIKYVYITTWSTVNYTSVIHCRSCCNVSWLWQTSSSVSSSKQNRCREDAVNMFRVRTTVIQLVMLAATVVVHCMLIKHREN